MNKHKARYWLSVGAQPTKGVIRLLNKYDFFPKHPAPHGTASVYEKPEKVYKINNFKDYFKKIRNPEGHFARLLQGEINAVERRKRIQDEAMANLGEGKYADDISLIKTDDMESEEIDIFERVKKFDELKKRFDKHRASQRHLRGNDLRYNIYLKKINKLTRMDLGLDVEGYKDYINNLKVFAKYNKDYEILATDSMSPDMSALHH